jgi:hypothetical protein
MNQEEATKEAELMEIWLKFSRHLEAIFLLIGLYSI